jgi:hypothetical protein
MDSMRNLRTSLPSTGRRPASQPPEELFQTFKEAALTVTNLYKAATSERTRVYQEGYQDALEDLLRFLDKENLGLQDGEGWRVRQWATERYQGSNHHTHVASDNEDEPEDESRAGSSSPVIPKKDTLDSTASHTQAEHVPPGPPRSESAPPPIGHSGSPGATRPPTTNFTIPLSDFTFESTIQPPATHDINMSNEEANNSNLVQINLIPSARQPRSTRRDSRTTTGRLGPGAGAKRSFPSIDFFDLGGFYDRDGKDRHGGGKRGRFA